MISGSGFGHRVRMTRTTLALAALVATSLTLVSPGPAGAVDPDRPTAEVQQLLQDDPTARLDRDGRLYYVEPTDAGQPDLVTGAAPFPLDQTFLLHSRPTSTHVIYLDVDGSTVSGTAWNTGTNPLPNGFYSGYSLDGDLTTFNDTERTQIQSIWQRVAEDYAAFDVDVTTQDPGDAAIDRTSAADQAFGTRALISDNTTASAAVCPTGCGGVAYVGVFDDFGTGTSSHAYHQPAWVFGHSLANNDTKDIAEAVSHEVGHNFGLSHDGTTASTSGCSSLGYYCGHAMWAPIMGVGYQKPVVQWSKGQYTNANQTQDDLAIIAAGGAPVVADEAGSTVATAAAGLPAKAFITSATDTDTFALGTCSGAVTVSAAGAPPSSDLDIKVELLNSAGAVLQSDDPVSALVNRDSATGLNAAISTTLAAGTYYARVDGVGNGTGATGYTDYASIGGYTLTATGCGTSGTPSAPTGLAVTPAVAGTSATVTWSPPSSDGGSAVTGYQLSRTGGAPVDLGLVGTHTWTGLTPGATYLFTVAAKNAVGTGLAASQSVTMPNVPGVPTSLVVTPAQDGRSATVAWASPASNGGSAVTGFHLTRTGAAPVDLGLQGTYTWGNLTPGTTYTFGVAATNQVGTGSAATQTATTNSVPGAPTGLAAASAPDGRSLTLSWSAPATTGGSGLGPYLVALDGGTPADAGSNGTYTWSGLAPGTTHQLTVVATNAVGSGPPATTGATTFNVPGAAPAPVAKKGRKGGKRTASVRWVAPAATGGSPVTGWTVLVYRASGALVKTVTGLGAGATAYTFKGRKGRYRFAVVAINSVGAGAASATSKAVKAQ